MVFIEDNSFILSTMQWSFSRLNSFHNCKYEWLLHYIESCSAESNFFSEYGKLMHELLEKYAKGTLNLFELNDYYESNFDIKIPHDAPPNGYVDIRQSYYEKGLDYINNIDLDLSGYEILGVEKKVEFELFDKRFIGFIDLLLKEKSSGEIVIVDHKSGSIKMLKSGDISKKDKEHFKEFCRQLYLYSLPVIQEYGNVSKLRWNMFKDRQWLEIPWKQEEYEETLQWVKDTLSEIEEEVLWLPSFDSYYCDYICGQRNTCEYKS